MTPIYGIWIDSTSEAADARSQRGDEPDIIVRTTEHTTGSTALELSHSYFAGKSFVREVEQHFRAKP